MSTSSTETAVPATTAQTAPAAEVPATGPPEPDAHHGNAVADLALSLLAPISWGTTYLVTADLLPPGRPLLAATLRALPAGLILLAVTRRLPRGQWWWKAAVLGTLNFGAFLPLLFYAAYHLPGGVAATIGSVQPLLVAGFAALVLKARPAPAVLAAALAGTGGVALLTLSAKARLDAVGIAAMLVATSLMALAIVLGKKWGSPEPPLVMVSWQLTIGGAMILPLMIAVEGVPAHLSGKNIAGFAYLGAIGTVMAYTLWFRGLERLPPTSLSLLSLANPVVATFDGFVFLDQSLTPAQDVGFAIALLALVAGQIAGARRVRLPKDLPRDLPKDLATDLAKN